ncbi:hypothetical protein [Amycolatopsis pittospori]|uniref:hypothetical protein n=1 Tax=Amycolatopsis pittospori TaxID=2749434 RepID=UPI0015F014BB|nr:hypothetical protein [Amycolatopsis pittospori]
MTSPPDVASGRACRAPVSVHPGTLLAAALVVTGAQPARVMLTVAGLINAMAIPRIEPASPSARDAVVDELLVITLAWFSPHRDFRMVLV